MGCPSGIADIEVINPKLMWNIRRISQMRIPGRHSIRILYPMDIYIPDGCPWWIFISLMGLVDHTRGVNTTSCMCSPGYVFLPFPLVASPSRPPRKPTSTVYTVKFCDLPIPIITAILQQGVRLDFTSIGDNQPIDFMNQFINSSGFWIRPVRTNHLYDQTKLYSETKVAYDTLRHAKPMRWIPPWPTRPGW